MTATQELVVPRSIPTMDVARAAEVENELCGTSGDSGGSGSGRGGTGWAWGRQAGGNECSIWNTAFCAALACRRVARAGSSQVLEEELARAPPSGACPQPAATGAATTGPQCGLHHRWAQFRRGFHHSTAKSVPARWRRAAGEAAGHEAGGSRRPCHGGRGCLLSAQLPRRGEASRRAGRRRRAVVREEHVGLSSSAAGAR